MIRFLLKGLLRDRQRSLFPVIIVSIGVMLTVLAQCWITGVLTDIIDYNANYSTGHVKVVSRAYAENEDQMPIDLAMDNARQIRNDLQERYPQMHWVSRIRFGGLIDVPDASGETRAQGPATGLAIDLLDEQSGEAGRFNIRAALVNGRMLLKSGQILLSNEFAGNLHVTPGDTVTLLTSTMYGSMSMYNFEVAGTVRFGVQALDRGSFVVDLHDARLVLDMGQGATEILGYFEDGFYDEQRARTLVTKFNSEYARPDDDFSPLMRALSQQNNLSDFLGYIDRMIGVFIFIFVLAMSIVLWNVGLIGGLRRYGETGLRLAIGESKGQVYRSMIYESVLVGLVGSLLGTLIGLAFAWLLQTVGIDVGSLAKNSSMMFPTVYRARITPAAWFIGFIPGLASTLLGTALSGIGIFKRQTARLFKEMEA